MKYCAGRKPRMSQIQKEGFVWKRLGLDTVQAADAHLKRQALYRTREVEVLRLLDIPPRPLVERERKKVAAWTDMGFDDGALRLAYEKTVYTLAEIEAGDKPRRRAAAPAMQDQPNPPGEADRRVREDLARMREFMRRQSQQEGK